MTDSRVWAVSRDEGRGALMDVVGRLGGGLHAWSLAVSFLGDCIVPRGGEVGVATISELLLAFGVDSGVTRTSLSRLAGEGWVSRQKVGRNSFYALTPLALAASEAASRRIYAARHPEAPCGWLTIYAGGLAREEQARVKSRLRRAGAAELAPQTWLLPDGGDLADAPPDLSGAIVLRAGPLPEGEARLLVARAFGLAALGADYARFVEAFAPVLEPIESGRKPGGLDALAMRVLVVHAFRKIALRDPMIPAPYLPPDWPGLAARRTTAAIWRALARPSELWLDANAASACGPLPPRSTQDLRF